MEHLDLHDSRHRGRAFISLTRGPILCRLGVLEVWAWQPSRHMMALLGSLGAPDGEEVRNEDDHGGPVNQFGSPRRWNCAFHAVLLQPAHWRLSKNDVLFRRQPLDDVLSEVPWRLIFGESSRIGSI